MSRDYTATTPRSSYRTQRRGASFRVQAWLSSAVQEDGPVGNVLKFDELFPEVSP